MIAEEGLENIFARHTYLAAALLAGIGVIACAWMRREPRSAVTAKPDRAAA